MFELALLFFGISRWLPFIDPAQPTYLQLGAGSIALAQVLFIASVVAGLLALMFHEPLERRVFHHA